MLLRATRSLVHAGLDLLLPHICPGCDRQVAARGLFCADCFGRFSLISEPLCRCCGKPFESADQAGAGGLCEDCRADRPEFAQARAAFRYDEHSRALILALKNQDRLDLVASLTPFVLRAGRPLLESADLLVPVPLHRGRMLSRRYNQSALLARAIAAASGVPCLPDALRRTRATRSLGHLGADERRAELEGAIAANPAGAARIAGQRVLLIDDVITTGATSRGCTRALLAAGAAQVNVLALARTASHHP